MQTSDVSIRLLTMFEAVYRTRSVSRAAEVLGVSQPSISIALGKLRKHFNDPLFVRTSQGMEPTVQAEQVAQAVRRAMELLDNALGQRAVFDPAAADTVFRVAMADITQMVMVPLMLARFRKEAPGARLQVVRYAGTPTLRAMESGEIDLALGFMPDVGPGFYEQTLIKRDFVCICSARHPRIGAAITVAQFSSEPHVVVRSGGSGMRHAETQMEGRRVRRNVLAEVPDFLGIESLIEGSDVIATVPRAVGGVLAQRAKLKVLEHPLKLTGYPIKQHWHERYHMDPRNQWLRQVVAAILQNKPAGTAEAATAPARY
jgi:DNA-binding transcriptional LysR family regulator